MNKYVYRLLCKNYERATKAMIKEWKKYKHDYTHTLSDVMSEYKKSLNMLRSFLDAEGMSMPQPKWRYDDQDQSTWLYTPQQQINQAFLMLQRKRKVATMSFHT